MKQQAANISISLAKYQASDKKAPAAIKPMALNLSVLFTFPSFSRLRGADFDT
jgi:hypothetical protein